MTLDTALLGQQQIALLERCREYIDRCEARGVDVAASDLCDVIAWAPGVGRSRLRFWNSGWSAAPLLASGLLTRQIAACFPQAWGIMNATPDSGDPARLVVSWCLGSDFDSQGTYVDRYLGESSSGDETTRWLLISVDGDFPSVLPKNVSVLAPLHRLARARTLAKPRVRSTGGHPSATTMVHSLSPGASLVTAVCDWVRSCVREGGVTELMMPYEAQPFQNAAFAAARLEDTNIRTLGYVHSMLAPLPTEMVHRSGGPAQIEVHGAGQARILTSLLGWKVETVTVSASRRYSPGSGLKFAGQIVLPYWVANPHQTACDIQLVLAMVPRYAASHLVVRPHPVTGKSPSYRRAVSEIEDAVRRSSLSSKQYNEPRPACIIVDATASLIEALESGLDVIHVCSEPVLEAHTSDIWDSLEVDQMAERVFRYRLRAPGDLICHV